MPSDAVWVAGITGFTTLAGTAIGYGTARAQQALDMRRMESEEKAAERKAEADAREARRTLYLTFLARVDALRPMLIGSEPTRAQITEWWEAYVDADRQVELVAHFEVHRATEPLYEHLDYITEWHEPNATDKIRDRLLKERWEAFNTTRENVIRCMRRDVGPGEPDGSEDRRADQTTNSKDESEAN